MTTVIDTATVPFGKRADYLVEAMEAAPLPFINVSESRFDSPNLRARFEGAELGDAFFTFLSMHSVRLKRVEREICRFPSGMLLIALLHGGSYEQEFNYHAPFSRTGSGDILILDLDGPQSVTFAQLSTLTCAYIPRRNFEPFIGASSIVEPVLIRSDNELHGLLAASFTASARMRIVSQAACQAALHTVTRLAMIAHGMHPLSCKNLRSSVLDARRTRARQFIAAQCSNPRLDVRMVADHLGISLRSLHLAFEPSGTAVAVYIARARLAHAREMLVRFPTRSILDIALECGFNNLATFYRGFGQEYGLPPGEHRKALADDAANELPRMSGCSPKSDIVALPTARLRTSWGKTD